MARINLATGKIGQPCMCGAQDCNRCFPDYEPTPICNECGCEVEEVNCDGICGDCEKAEAEQRAAVVLHDELKLEGMTLDLAEKVLAAIADEKIVNLFLDYQKGNFNYE